MKHPFHLKPLVLIFCFVIGLNVSAQIKPGIYTSDLDNVIHELKITDDYMIHSIYEKTPARFIKTEGGFYTIEDSELRVKLEFNSNYSGDTISSLSIPFTIKNDQLILGTTPKLIFDKSKAKKQDLDGQWLFATRGPDSGQERRGEKSARKTLKFLKDGKFQWIAYNTDTFEFHGTGGGTFTSNNGNYTENIEYFSKDNSRVGATLKFQYELKNDDWHHTGNNSKGEPMYEIWSKR
ncbi:hypothetical protein JQC67_04965 [Aurantibacter crassamenti]|uniref:hypothetical protein n=1 Tax=Aurantibacter crassamenti TaxID=1837375 RepID=UPI00193AA3D5|nr:hypothetical protein [Aurantibacter crassamenti]MBM1105487.1 hypothetical protein [Aurantibacter crassamenti]